MPAPGHTTNRRSTRARRRMAAVWVVLAACWTVFATPVLAQGAARDSGGAPVVLDADEVQYDDQLGIVTARGNVEITQGDRTLRADVVSYNRQSNVVTASGNVSMAEPTGEVVFSDYIELGQDMTEGVVQNLRMLLADRPRLAAVSARRSGGNTTIARRGVYSPCELCKDDPTRAPLWQI